MMSWLTAWGVAHILHTERKAMRPGETIVDGKPTPKRCSAPLRADKGDDWVRCTRCKTQHDVETIIAAAKARVENELRTLHWIGQYLEKLGRPVPSSTLYDLAYHPKPQVPKRGWLVTDPQGRQSISGTWIHRDHPPVYRVGDVVRYFERRPRTIDPHRPTHRKIAR